MHSSRSSIPNPHQITTDELCIRETAIGLRFTRIHRDGVAPTDFRIIGEGVANGRFRGFRFDATGNATYGVLYAATDDDTAVCETLIRVDATLDEPVEVNRLSLEDRQVSWFSSVGPLALVDLDHSSINNNRILTSGPETDYPQTQKWAVAIRRAVPEAHGFFWSSRFNSAGNAFVFFEGPCDARYFERTVQPAPVVPADSNLLTPGGILWLQPILARHHALLAEIEVDA